MATVIQTANLSREIILNQFRDPMRAEVGSVGSGARFEDPQSGSRDSAHPFIVTSYPSSDILYPMIVVQEAGDSGRRPDARVGLTEHNYAVSIQIGATSSTTLFDLRDSFRAWFEARIDTFNANGFEDPELTPSGRPSWESDPKIKAVELAAEGTVTTSTQ